MKKQQVVFLRGCCRGKEIGMLVWCRVSVARGCREQDSRERGAERTEAKQHHAVSLQEMGRREQKKYYLDWCVRLAVRCDRARGGEASVGYASVTSAKVVKTHQVKMEISSAWVAGHLSSLPFTAMTSLTEWAILHVCTRIIQLNNFLDLLLLLRQYFYQFKKC
jgi:hypothetical protein